jgi:uncharacterized LabA/DUF88 family protein
MHGTPPPVRRTIVYIDGFNLYYRAIRNTPGCKCLNLERFCRLLRPHDDIRIIRYFTALVDGPAQKRQQDYLRALSTTPLVDVILGKFKRKTVKCGVTSCNSAGSKWFDTMEERRTDVNIAIFMLDDAYRDVCDQLIVFSGDSDLVPAIHMVKLRFPMKRTIVYVPSLHPVRGAAVELRTSADLHKTLPVQLLKKAQFPEQMADGAGGVLRRPAAW